MATPWVTIDADLVLTKLSSPELVAARTRVIASGQSDPLPEAITQVVDSVRQGIGQNANNVLADGQTVPPSAVRHVLAILRPAIIARIPTLAAKLMDEIRKTEWENAEKWVASKPLVESPVDPAETQLSSPRPRITEKTRIFTGDDQAGL